MSRGAGSSKVPAKLPANVMRLVHSSETVKAEVNQDALAGALLLLADVRAGRFDGFAYVATSSNGEYVGGVKGAAKNRPVYTRGLLRYLDDFIAGRV